MKPSVSRIVIYRQPSYEAPHNGAREHPAIVTRVWGSGDRPCVNLTVFPDFAAPYPVSSVLHVSQVVDEGRAWDWPARTE